MRGVKTRLPGCRGLLFQAAWSQRCKNKEQEFDPPHPTSHSEPLPPPVHHHLPFHHLVVVPDPLSRQWLRDELVGRETPRVSGFKLECPFLLILFFTYLLEETSLTSHWLCWEWLLSWISQSCWPSHTAQWCMVMMSGRVSRAPGGPQLTTGPSTVCPSSTEGLQVRREEHDELNKSR